MVRRVVGANEAQRSKKLARQRHCSQGQQVAPILTLE
jgi:hypothetical protein